MRTALLVPSIMEKQQARRFLPDLDYDCFCTSQCSADGSGNVGTTGGNAAMLKSFSATESRSKHNLYRVSLCVCRQHWHCLQCNRLRHQWQRRVLHCDNASCTPDITAMDMMCAGHRIDGLLISMDASIGFLLAPMMKMMG